MVLAEKQTESFKEVSEPLIKWLNENADPHCKVIVDNDSAELLQGSCSHVTKKYIRD
jgi:hypothetical protein